MNIANARQGDILRVIELSILAAQQDTALLNLEDLRAIHGLFAHSTEPDYLQIACPEEEISSLLLPYLEFLSRRQNLAILFLPGLNAPVEAGSAIDQVRGMCSSFAVGKPIGSSDRVLLLIGRLNRTVGRLYDEDLMTSLLTSRKDTGSAKSTNAGHRKRDA